MTQDPTDKARDEKKTILRKALAQAHVTQLEAMLLIQEIFEDVKKEQLEGDSNE